MAKELSIYYNEPWVPEFATEYLESLERDYNFEDLKHIAIGQLILQNRHHQNARKLLFLDTDATVIKVWSEYKYGKTDEYVEYLLKSNTADLYLLMDIDLEYEEGKLREHPDLEDRKKLLQLYKRQLREMKVDFELISGKKKERFKNALQEIEKKFKK